MPADSALTRAEEHLQKDEQAGMVRNAEQRAIAKLALSESFELDDRRETSVTGASSASERGKVIGTGLDDQSLEQIDAELVKLRNGPATAESFKARKILNAQKARLLEGVDELPILLQK